MIGHLHHVALAVRSIKDYRAPFPVRHAGPLITDPHWGRVQLLHTQGGIIELIENGREGLDHLCFVTDDIAESTKELRDMGYMPIGQPHRAKAFDGRLVSFLLTPEHSIIELLETA